MQYTEFGKTGIQVSRLGFGCMRFPSREVDGKKVFDEEESIRMMHRAMELGVNYFDTAPGYCEKQSEIIVGKALKGRRDKFLVQTKCSLNWRGEGGNFHYERDGATVMNDTSARAVRRVV